jgi:hypothetical protein
MRQTYSKLLAARRAAMKSRHLGCRSCFINEHELFWIKIESSIKPGAPPAQDIGSLLFSAT